MQGLVAQSKLHVINLMFVQKNELCFWDLFPGFLDSVEHFVFGRK